VDRALARFGANRKSASEEYGLALIQ
jgi:mannose-6-phosphate isomerase-like protein (cupin superfamily)